MQILVINFSLDGIAESDFRAECEQLAPTFAEIPGLTSKTWLASPETNTWGGIYVFDTADALDAYLESPLCAAVRTNPAFVDQRVSRFDVLEAPSAITRSLAGLTVS